MNTIFVIAKKEVKDAFKNRIFDITLLLLFLLTVVSIILGTLQVKVQMDAYNNSILFLKSIGKSEFPPMPNLNPISVSKSFVNYIGMIGAILSIILGNYSISKEKRSGTLKLILSRPIFRDSFLNGKLFGNLFILLVITISAEIITFSSLLILANIQISADDFLRLNLFFLMSFLYMIFFFILSLMFTILISKENKSILITILVWLMLAFVFPQIGDTMDLDNQLPGGFFAQMGMTRDQEHQILNKFKFYETVRDGIEELSPTKHYERVSYALLNIKPGFEKNTAIEILGLKWVDLSGLTIPSIILIMLSYGFYLKKENIY